MAREHAFAAPPQLTGILFVIVGTAAPPACLRAWFDDGVELREAMLEQNY